MAGTVVDDQEDLSARVLLNEFLQEQMKRVPVENVCELVREPGGLLKRERSVNVGGLPQTIGVDAGLDTSSRPGLVERSVEPEARFVLEDYDASACSGFFFISGRRSRIQVAWASALARASRLRGRWTENPSLLRSRGMW